MVKILKFISSALFTITIVLAVLLVGVKLLGLQVYTVLSGSMEPEIHTGSLIYVREIEPTKLEKGDIITYRISGNMTATHRIVEVISDESNPDNVQFRTKGDANDMVDPSPIDGDAVIGTTIFSVPYLGYLAVYMQHPPGIYLVIAISAAIILFVIAVDMLTDGKNKSLNK